MVASYGFTGPDDQAIYIIRGNENCTPKNELPRTLLPFTIVHANPGSDVNLRVEEMPHRREGRTLF